MTKKNRTIRFLWLDHFRIRIEITEDFHAKLLKCDTVKCILFMQNRSISDRILYESKYSSSEQNSF